MKIKNLKRDVLLRTSHFVPRTSFQPFFTTKPTVQGTGLGLSLSYDIVKAQGGELRVETNEGEGSEFAIQLPFV
jgi:signal transduction histidine kinase